MIFIITIIIIIIIPKLLWVWPLLYKYIILFHQKIYIYIYSEITWSWLPKSSSNNIKRKIK